MPFPEKMIEDERIWYPNDFGELEDFAGVSVLEAMGAVALEDEEGGGLEDEAVPLLLVPVGRRLAGLSWPPPPRVLHQFCPGPFYFFQFFLQRNTEIYKNCLLNA